MTDEENPESAGIPTPPLQSKGVLDEREDGHSPFPIVGIGASAGGFEAFQQLLSSLPPKTGMAFVLVQHLDPHHESRLTQLLSRSTAMPVIEATDGLRVEPNHVYVIPPNSNLAIAQGILRVRPRGEGAGLHVPVDYLFRSLAEDQKSRAIGVILSGTGSDGAQGLCEIKAVGGITFAQDEQSAKYNGMPRSAIEGGWADFVLPPQEIAQRLAEIRSHPYLVLAPSPQPVEDIEMQYRRVLTRLRRVTGVDFSLYRDATIKRRIMRRMALHTQKSLASYIRQLEADSKEVEALYNDLLINVTSFFRDPEVFDALKQHVFPEISRNKSPTTPLRIWVPGCSTGQEAYSLAIALVEYFGDKPVRLPIQIFATDISDPPSLERARAGVYPEGIEMEVTPERLRRFFRKEDHVYRVEKMIRDMCVFARQNVTSDPPFSHMDLISCRNVLTYLAAPLQKRVLPAFHYALNTPGYLVLGINETVGDSSDLFEIANREYKIYLKKPATVRPHAHYTSPEYKIGTLPDGLPSGRPTPTPDFYREADRLLLGRYAPPGVLVDENFNVIQYRGRTGAYLESPPGEPTNNVLKMAREGLFLELRSALMAAAKEHKTIESQGIRVRVNSATHIIDLEVVPIQPPSSSHPCFLVLFHDAEARMAPVAAAPAEAVPPADAQEIDQLRRELSATKEYLQSLLEQQDAANEELRSANEEILSSNEELQSTNEELETAKEELQATNEELTTVNEQLQYRNVELNQISNDLQNLLTSTAIPVVMVGPDLKIRRFTSAARKVMNLVTSDVGRPIGDLKTNLDIPDLTTIIEEVIDQVQVREREVRDTDGRWHVLRFHPYRTADRKIEGAVIVLLDIDEIKQAQKILQQHADLLELAHEAILAYEWGGPIVYWNRGATELYGYTPEEALGHQSHTLLGTDRSTASGFEQELERSGHWVGEIKQRTKDGREVIVESRQQIVTRSDNTRLVLETNRDVTDRKRLQEELSLRFAELKQADRHKNEFLATLAHELRNPLAPVTNIVELLRVKDLRGAEQEWCHEVLERQIKQMTRMLDDLLDVGRITGGMLELRKAPVELRHVIESAVETSRSHIDAQEHKLSVDLPPESIVINADSARLEQVFSNLLINAAKYTPRGGEIGIGTARENSQAVIRVKDSGIGISPELLPRIFDLFVQERPSTGEEPAGLGLGLTIVRKVVELHDGTIEAHSAGRGQGSEFIVRLPLADKPAAQEKPRPPRTRTRHRKRILVVDDREEQTRSLRMLLERMGHEVHVAIDGPAALKTLGEHPCDIALIDIGLQGMDGHELARRIRQEPKFKDIVLIAQTGWGREIDRQRSRDAGFHHHLVKPVDRKLLEEILENGEK